MSGPIPVHSTDGKPVEQPNNKHVVTQWDSFNKMMFLLHLLTEPLLNKEQFRVVLTKDPESRVVQIDYDFSSYAESGTEQAVDNQPDPR